MMTMYNVGDTVLIKAKIVNASIDKYGVRYLLEQEQICHGTFRLEEKDIPFKLTDGGVLIDPHLKGTITDAEDTK